MARLQLLLLCALPAATQQLAHSALRSADLLAAEEEAQAAARKNGFGTLLEGLAHDVAGLQQGLSRALRPTLLQLNDRDAVEAAAATAAPVLDPSIVAKQMDKLGPKQMPAMLGLLTGMYDTWKDKIGQANKREQEQKNAFERTIADLKQKEKQAAADNKDAAATYGRIEKYWRRQRDISHHQYHTALKIMHAGMAKFKAVAGAMQDAIKGKLSKKDLRTIGAMPEIVFVQMQVADLDVWARDAAQQLVGSGARRGGS